MTDAGTNIYILARSLKALYGDGEFTKEQFVDELIEGFRFIDSRSHEKYLGYALQWKQIKQTESGNFIATPKPFLSPKERMLLLEKQKDLDVIDGDVERYEEQVKAKKVGEKPQ
jgi:hypothetical protein